MTGVRRLPAWLPVFFLSLLAMLATVEAHAREMVSIARAEVNMRAGPGTRHDILWALSRGYPLSVVGRQGNWIKVSDFESDQGWVLRSLTGRTPHHVVKARVANLRSRPTTQGRILGKLQYGDVLRTLGREGSWVKVRKEDGGPTGWVARNLLWGW